MAAPHLYEQIARNKRNSYALIIGMSLLFASVGFVLGYNFGSPLLGLGFALIAALIYGGISFFSGDKIVMASMGAKPIEKSVSPQLHNVVEEMAIAAGIPMPSIYYIDSAASNAFATGRSPEKAAIAITRGLLEQLNREELQGVIGHEIAHIKNLDTRFSILMAVMVGAIALLCDGAWRSLRYMRRSSSKDSAQIQAVIAIVAIILAILAPFAAKAIQFAMSRRRELLADNTAVELTRNPEGLAKALEKIAGDPDELDVANRGTQHLFIINPLHAAKAQQQLKAGKKIKEKAGWFDTHPPLQLRIRLLREMSGRLSPD